jgi:ferredoxin-NADP reductase
MAGTALRRRLTWLPATVVELVDETRRVRSLVLDVDEWPGHRPGQHVDVRLTAEDGYQAERSYSIASSPEERRLVLTVERLDDGEVSPYLAGELEAGEQFELRGPIGGYFVWEASQGGPLFLVGGGSGIVPLMSMARHRAAAGADVDATLLGSWRTLEDVIYREELDRLAGDGLRVVHTLTREQPPGWDGYARRVDDAMIAEVAPPRDARPHAFVCGPTSFVEAVAVALVNLGHEPMRIRTERFGPTGG